MTKEALKEFGLTEEQVEKVWSGLVGNYIPKSRFNEINTKKNQLEEQLKDRDSQLEKLKTESGAADKLTGYPKRSDSEWILCFTRQNLLQ